MGWRFWEQFERRPAKKVKGGIRAESKRGQFGQSWWAKRWIAALEQLSYDISSRLARGRSYARGGQVLSIDIGKGIVSAKVQGSRPQPYKVSIKIKELAAAQWKKVADALAEQVVFAAKLLAGQMPEDIETVFQAAKVPLFPASEKDLVTDCSCPDWSNPCKHIAAVYYLIGEEIDRDPFLLFKLRGITRDELLPLIGPAPAATDAPAAVEPSEPLPADPAAFWAAPALPDDFFGPVQTPPVAAALPKRLGKFPLWRGQEPLLDAVEPLYRNAAQYALDILAPSSPADRGPR